MFSVVIPAYNCERTIEQVLDSVRQQSRIDLIEEVLVINDGSTDSTHEVIQAYIERFPTFNIRYITQRNVGVSRTRNRGILEAKAEWIALLDSDDSWLPEKIERQYQIILQQPDIVFLGAHAPLKVLFKERKGLVKLTPEDLCWRSMPSTPSIVFKRNVGIELGLFNEQMVHCEDINFFQKFLLKDSYYVLAEELVNINIHKSYHGMSGLSSNFDGMHQGRQQNIRELYQMGLISKMRMQGVLFLNHFKLIRRKMILRINRLQYRKKNHETTNF